MEKLAHNHIGKGLQTRRRSKLIISALVCTLIVLILALGLGLGLGLRHQSSEQVPTARAIPTPTGKWEPEVGLSWQIVLNDGLQIDNNAPAIQPDVDVYDIDMFTHQNTSVVEHLHSLGKRVICYFSAGSYEPYRPDSYLFHQRDLGNTLDGWEDEYWLDIRSQSIHDIMASRIKVAYEMGCDGIDPDNIDGYHNENGLRLTKQDAINFVSFLAKEADRYNLATGLKNGADMIEDVLPLIQFSVNEQCAEYEECQVFAAFIDSGKPVFHIEYPAEMPNRLPQGDRAAAACSAPGTEGFSTVLKTMELTGWVEYCNGHTAKTSVLST